MTTRLGTLEEEQRNDKNKSKRNGWVCGRWKKKTTASQKISHVSCKSGVGACWATGAIIVSYYLLWINIPDFD